MIIIIILFIIDNDCVYAPKYDATLEQIKSFASYARKRLFTSKKPNACYPHPENKEDSHVRLWMKG